MSRIFNNDLIGVKQSVVDELLLLNPMQTPMLSLLGFGQAVTQVEHTWFEDEMVETKASVTTAADVAATSLVVDSVEAFRPNQVIKINDELILVTAVDATNLVLTVVRGYASTIAAAVAVNAVAEVLFVEGSEGAEAREARYKPRKRISNVSQIFDDSIELSGTALAVAQYGIDNLYETEKQKKQLELALQLEKALINGVYYDNGNVRQMKGIRSFIESNVTDAAGAAISEDLLANTFQSIYEAGGFQTGGNFRIIVPAKQKVAISRLSDALLRLERGDNARGNVVDFFVSDFGRFEFMLNNNLRSDEIIIVDANRMNLRPLQQRAFSHTYLGTKGDYMQGMLVGEYTLEFFQEKAHARLSNLG